jgi:hypothetical protein
MYLEAELDDANMDECEQDFVDDTGLFEDEASDESVGSESGELDDGEVYGKSERRKASERMSKCK